MLRKQLVPVNGEYVLGARSAPDLDLFLFSSSAYTDGRKSRNIYADIE